jgi:hypothetical protein
MSNGNKDAITKVCSILNIADNSIITFEDFVELEYNKPYDEVKDLPEVKLLRKAWNISCESLLNVLEGISLISKNLEIE